MTKRSVTFISDPGHGWLSVKQADLLELGIVDKISRYSYLDGSRAYLEEDCDAGLYIDAAKKAGWDLNIKQSYRKSFNRALGSYEAGFVKSPINIGRKVFDYKGAEYTVTGENAKKWILDGGLYGVAKSNPYKSVCSEGKV